MSQDDFVLSKTSSMGKTVFRRHALQGVPVDVAFDAGWSAHKAGAHAKANPLDGVDPRAAIAFSGGFALRAAALRAGVLS